MSDAPELSALTARIEAHARSIPPIREIPAAEARRLREEGRSVFGPIRTSLRAAHETLATPGGTLPVRVITPSGDTTGVYVHLHGGGWVLGAVHHQDPRLVRLADATGQVVVSVGYRLAPENPYPAGPDDCEAAALALIEQAPDRFGTARLTIGGESAGAHLALVTLLRLRDRHGYTGFRAANLLYGVYDLRRSPSARLYGSRPTVLDGEAIAWFIEQYVQGADPDNPDVSPLLADVAGMPPAIFTIGTDDPLVDDTLFLHQRWLAAGLDAELQVFEHAPHAFDAFEISIASQAHDRINAFLHRRVCGD